MAKTAQSFAAELGGLDALYGEPEKIAGLTFREKNSTAKLEQNKDLAYLSYKLATIQTDVELELGCEQLTVITLDVDELLELFKKYEFKRWITDVESAWMQAKGGKPRLSLHNPRVLWNRKKKLR